MGGNAAFVVSTYNRADGKIYVIDCVNMSEPTPQKIQKAIEEMRAVIEHDNEYFEGGSRRRRRRRQKQPLYTRIFSMSTREFSKLFKKL